uniref:CID domain-containing protein n=1 Tax=Ciona savignyi TaxID=51511 RepID=H2Z1L4_CIOSA
MDSVLAEYEASLAELTFNSKPHINMLTVLAEENVNHASEIAMIIKKQLYVVPLKRKLPVLYLMDSIVKNFGGHYRKLFSQSLVDIFLNVFDKADGKIRGDLYKLRSTWDTTFPSVILKELDKTIRTVDHHWPMRSRKHSRSKNPLGLGQSSSGDKYSGDEMNGEDTRKMSESDKPAEVEELVEEEEIEMDDESLGVLEMLEEKLRRRQAELTRLEYLDAGTTSPEVYQPPNEEPEDLGAEEDDDGLKIDLGEFPVIPMDVLKEEPDEKSPIKEEGKVPSLSEDEDLADVSRWKAHSSSFEPKKRMLDDLDRITKGRVISHFNEDAINGAKATTPGEEELVSTSPSATSREFAVQTEHP